MKTSIEVGVFIPIGKHGWIHSVNSPPAETGTFDRLLEITRGAETLGFDFVLSPAIWRGFKGPSEHWMTSLESITATAALLQATDRIKIFATVHVTVFPPAAIAKQMFTLDQIAPGRVGMNIVTGASYLDLVQPGLWVAELDHDRRYDYAGEWIQLMKRLWSEKKVTHKGEFFETMDATGTNPTVRPTLVNAGTSNRGFRFASENCDIAFIPASDDALSAGIAKRAREAAREAGNPNLKLFGLCTLMPGETDAEAQAMVDHFNAGVDLECLDDMAQGYQLNPSRAQLDDAGVSSRAGGLHQARSAISQGAFIGSYETIARRLATAVIDGGLDGILVRVPDFVVDLEKVATHVLPRMADYGVTCNVSGSR